MKDWIAADESNKQYFEQFKLIWDTSKQLAVTSTADENKAWEKFQNKIRGVDPKVVPLKKKKFAWGRIAASVILVAGLGFLAYMFLNKPVPEESVYAENAPLTDTLPDNSVVTLNKHSLISYRENEGGNNRTVRLKGEAFFNVAHNKKKPFIVSVNRVEITVVGTSFNVKGGYDGVTEVVVETGIVRVANADTMIELHAGERVTINDKGSSVEKQQVTEKLYNYYRTRLFVCDDTPLWKLVDVVNEAYEASIVIEGEGLKNRTISTTFNNESLDQIINVISGTVSCKYTKKGDQVILHY